MLRRTRGYGSRLRGGPLCRRSRLPAIRCGHLENRFVAGELEARWNRALTRVAAYETRIAQHDAAAPAALPPISLDGWPGSSRRRRGPQLRSTDVRLKKRIVRLILHEAVADIDDSAAEIVLTLHWVGFTDQHRLSPVVGVGNTAYSSARHRPGRLLVGADLSRPRHCRCLNRNGQKPVTAIAGRDSEGYLVRSSYRIPYSVLIRNTLRPNLSQAAAVVGAALVPRLAAERGDVKAIHLLPHAPGFQLPPT